MGVAAKAREAWFHSMRRMRVRGAGSVILRVMALTDSLGSGAYLTMSALVLTEYLGYSIARAAVLLALAATCGALVLVPLGKLADAWSPKWMLVVLYLARGIGFVTLFFRPDFFVVLLLLCVTVSSERSARALIQTLAMSVDPIHSMDLMARVRRSQNVGMCVGALIAADESRGISTVILVNSGSFFVAGCLASILYISTTPSTLLVRTHQPIHGLAYRIRSGVHSLDRRLLSAAALSSVLGIQTSILVLALPLWIVHRTDLPTAIAPCALLFNAFLVILFQVRMSSRISGVMSASKALIDAGILLIAMALMFSFLQNSMTLWLGASLVLGMVLFQSFAEMRQQAGAWGISYALANPGRLSADLSLFNLGSAIRDIFSPLAIAAIVAAPGSAGWICFAFVILAVVIAIRRCVPYWEVPPGAA